MMGMLMRGEEERGRATSEKLRGEEERFLLVADAAWELHLAAPARESVPHGDAQFLAWRCVPHMAMGTNTSTPAFSLPNAGIFHSTVPNLP